MKQHHGLWLFVVIGAWLLVGAALASCAPDTSAPELNTEARTENLVTPTDPVEVAQADPADTDSPAADVPAAVSDTYCLDCHTNQEIMQGLAVEEETGEALSEGPG
jgi:hypothetical protein